MIKPYEPLYTVKEASQVLKVNEAAVYQLIRGGKLPCLVLGRMKIKGIDLERFIQNYPVAEGSELECKIMDRNESTKQGSGASPGR